MLWRPQGATERALEGSANTRKITEKITASTFDNNNKLLYTKKTSLTTEQNTGTHYFYFETHVSNMKNYHKLLSEGSSEINLRV